MRRAEAGATDAPDEEGERMANQWLKRCCVGAMIAVVTASSLPMQAFAEAGGVSYTGGDVSAQVSLDGKTVTIGNDAISRTFSIADKKLKTTEIDNKRANTKLSLAEGGSEEFIIKRTKKDNNAEPVQEPIDKNGWTAQADSEEMNKEGDAHGFAQNLIDGKTGTIWHTQYSNNTKPAMPHEVVIDLGKPTTFKSFSYDPRYTEENGVNINGNITGYTLWTSAADTPPAIESDEGWTQVANGSFNYKGNKGEPFHVNIDETALEHCKDVQCVKLVATSNVNENEFAGGEEFDLYAEPWTEPKPHEEPSMFLKSSELELDGDPVVTDTNPTINKQQKTGKKLSFKFKPVEFNGATYTITENIVMYNGDHYMRKYLEISVPEEDKLDAEIDYIDLESIDVTNVAEKDRWTIPTNQGVIVGQTAERAILGQPFYADGMFFGCEFPAADTQIVKENGKQLGRPRYYTGKTMDRLANDGQAVRAEDGTISYSTWQTVAGAAAAKDYRVVQADFFDYIDDISVPSEFRVQYSSWYDYQKNITEQNVYEGFINIDKEFANSEMDPLDTYAVDDGWMNYSANPGFWAFDKNKFPNEFDPIADLVQNFGSGLGVWIGPRGGYGTQGAIANSLQAQGLGMVAGGSIDVADRTYLENYAKLVCDFQNKWHVNYWKWDGFADENQYNYFGGQNNSKDGLPGHSGNGTIKGHMTGGRNQMYHCSDMWEAWIDLYEVVRANAEDNGIANYWISSTTHTIPSPWLLQWVNSVWLQCQFDHARTDHGSTVHDGNLNARDAVYYNFVNGHMFQFPLSHIYNHDPVYGKDPEGPNMKPDTATAEGFQNYLYTMAGRGTAFWELYYSDAILDEEKYEVNAEFFEWYEQNYHLLRNARMFGGWPVEGVTLGTGAAARKDGYVKLNSDGRGIYNTYGYAGFEGDEGILTVRNANAEKVQALDFTFDDATLGVKGNAGDTFDYVIERRHTQPGDTSKIADKGTFTIGKRVSLELQPEESLTIRVTKPGAGDKQGPSIETVRHDGKTELIVRMDEKVKGDAKFTVNGKDVPADKVKRSADGVTFHITLDKAPEQGEKLDVKVSGITDMAGNAIEGDAYAVDFHGDNVVASRCPSRLTSYNKRLASKDASLASKTGFTVFSKVKAAGYGPLVKQEGAYELGIGEDGVPYFTVNGVRALGKTKVNDGEEHTVAGVRENNGNLKVYIDGELSKSAYDVKNFHFATSAGDILFAGGSFNKDTDEASAKVYDRALGYDEIKAMHDKVIPDMSERNLAKNKQVEAAYTADGSEAAKGKDRPMSMAVDGVKNDTDNNYGEFGSDNKPDKSAYMQVDLGSEYELTGIHMWRYWKDSRKYNNTLVVTSVDGTFSKDDEDDVVVFNADEANECGYGKGEERDYEETAEGKNFPVMPGTRARYVRVYMNGSDHGKTNHVVELEVMGKNLPSKPGEQIDTSKLYQRIDEVRATIESGKWTPESVQKVMDKLEAAELVADCPKSEEQVKKALDELKGIEGLLKKAVTVTFAYKGDVPAGVEAPAALDIEQGTALGDKLPVPTAEGYVFAGWFTDEACTAGNEFTAKTKVASDMTVFGKWAKDDGTVPPAPKPPVDPEPEQPKPEQPEQKPSQKPGKPGAGLPQTGDDSMLPIAACGVAGVALVATALVIRKRRKA